MSNTRNPTSTNGSIWHFVRLHATVAFSLVAVYSTHAAAQSSDSLYRIQGTVLEPDGRPVPGVEVRPIPSGASVMTDQLGRFRVLLARHGTAALQFRRPGYRAQVIRFSGDWTGIVRLERGAYNLPEVGVTVRNAKPSQYAWTTKYDDYFRRARRGFGQFVGRDEIERRGALHVAQLLEGRAGIRVSFEPGTMNTSVFFARCNERPPRINVYLDGRKLIPPLAADIGSLRADGRNEPEQRSPVGDMLDRIAIGDVELIEFFRGPGELPAEFNDGNCGAISIWTRTGGR